MPLQECYWARIAVETMSGNESIADGFEYTLQRIQDDDDDEITCNLFLRKSNSISTQPEDSQRGMRRKLSSRFRVRIDLGYDINVVLTTCPHIYWSISSYERRNTDQQNKTSGRHRISLSSSPAHCARSLHFKACIPLQPSALSCATTHIPQGIRCSSVHEFDTIVFRPMSSSI